MRAYRVHERNGYIFEDSEPEKSCVYDVVNVRLPAGALIFDFGGMRDVLRRIRLADNTYTYLGSEDNAPALFEVVMRDGVSLPMKSHMPLEYEVLERDVQSDYDELASRAEPDNIYRLVHSDGRYRLLDLYGSRIITKAEAMRCKGLWG